MIQGPQTMTEKSIRELISDEYVIPTLQNAERTMNFEKTLKTNERKEYQREKRNFDLSQINQRMRTSLSVPILPKIEISSENMIYKSPRNAHFVLQKNYLIHTKIADALEKELREKYQKVIADAKEKRKQIQLMPKIRKGPPKHGEEGRKLHHGRVGNSLVKLSQKQTFKPSPSAQPAKSNVKKLLHSQNTGKMVFYWRLIEQDKWKPEVREGATFTTVGQRAYLFGGLSGELHDTISSLQPLKDYLKYDWQRMSVFGDIPRGRFGHTAYGHKKHIYTFAGARKYNHATYARECLNDVFSYNVDGCEWEEFRCGGKYIEPRRNHGCAIVGKHLVAYGGINEKGQYLDDLYGLNLVTYKWLSVAYKGESPGKLAFHTMQLIVFPERQSHSQLGLFRLPDVKISPKSYQKIQLEGVYLFGGRDEKGNISNKLRVLKIGKKKPNEWVDPDAGGIPPIPRYGHTMNYYPDLSILIIFGGRNDNEYHTTRTSYLNDIHVFSLEYLQWVRVEVSGCIPRPRYSHAACILGSKLIIYGGINDDNYCNSDLYLLELDISYAEQLRNDPMMRQLKRKQANMNDFESNQAQQRLQAMQDYNIEDYEKTQQQLNQINLINPEITEFNPEIDVERVSKVENMLKQEEEKRKLAMKSSLTDLNKVGDIIHEIDDEDIDNPPAKKEPKPKLSSDALKSLDIGANPLNILFGLKKT